MLECRRELQVVYNVKRPQKMLAAAARNEKLARRFDVREDDTEW